MSVIRQRLKGCYGGSLDITSTVPLKKVFFSSDVTPNSSSTSSNLEASDSLPTAEDCEAADNSLEARQKAPGKTSKEAEEASGKDGVQDIETNKGEKSKVVKYIFFYQCGPANIVLFDLLV